MGHGGRAPGGGRGKVARPAPGVKRRATRRARGVLSPNRPTRLAIVERLRDGPAAAGDIAAGFRVSRPAIARHVRVLRQARVVHVRQDRRHRMYSLNPDSLQLVDRWLAAYRHFWTSRLQELKHHLESTPDT